MDRKLPQAEEIRRLIETGDASRRYLGDGAAALKQKLDVPARIGGSLKTHPTGWMIGSLVVGLAGSMLLRRRGNHSVKKPRGLVFSLLGLALTAARPVAKVWLADQVKAHFAGRPTGFMAQRQQRPSDTKPPI